MQKPIHADACNPMHERPVARRQRGVALFMGLVLLLVLTLVALVAMRSTLLDMRVTSSTAQHEQAFEASEAARAIPEALLSAYAYYHGWPQSWGGTVPDAQYQLSDTFLNRKTWLKLLAPSGSNGLQTSCNGALANFILNVPCISGQTASYNYTPSKWAPTFVMNTCTDGTSAPCASASKQVVNTVAIVRDGVSTNAGSGAAAQQGYASIGVGNARGGALLMLQIRSSSVVAGSGQAVTIAQYRLNIVN